MVVVAEGGWGGVGWGGVGWGGVRRVVGRGGVGWCGVVWGGVGRRKREVGGWQASR